MFLHQLTQFTDCFCFSTPRRSLNESQNIFAHFFYSHILFSIQIHIQIKRQFFLAGNYCDFFIKKLFDKFRCSGQSLLIEFQSRKDVFVNRDRGVFLGDIVAFGGVEIYIFGDRIYLQFGRFVMVMILFYISVDWAELHDGVSVLKADLKDVLFLRKQFIDFGSILRVKDEVRVRRVMPVADWDCNSISLNFLNAFMLELEIKLGVSIWLIALIVHDKI